MHTVASGTVDRRRCVANRVIMFSDIVGSTKLMLELGGEAWTSLLDRHDEICAETVRMARGELVQSTGDGSLSLFCAAADALSAAATLRRRLDAAVGVRARIGIHCGDVFL